MTQRKSQILLVLASLFVMAFALTSWAQDTTTVTTSTGKAAKQVQVESGEVVYVSGNEVVVKMANGAVRHVTAPAGATAMVDGKKIGVKDLKPGMKLQKTITTTTTPKTITTMRTIKGKVWFVNAPSTVILQLPDGTNKKYKVPSGQKFTINGQSGLTVFDLKKGMEVEASVVKEVPETVVASSSAVTGELPPPPPPATPPVVETPAQPQVLLVEVEEVVEVPVQAPTPAKLPKTGSELPLTGLLGVLMMLGSAGMNLVRRIR